MWMFQCKGQEAKKKIKLKIQGNGTSLAVQGLPMKMWVWFLVGELRFWHVVGMGKKYPSDLTHHGSNAAPGLCVSRLTQRVSCTLRLPPAATVELWWWLFSYSVVSDSFVTSWTVARQVPLSMGFSRQEYWNGLPFPSLGDLPDPGIKFAAPSLVGGFFTAETPRKP